MAFLFLHPFPVQRYVRGDLFVPNKADGGIRRGKLKEVQVGETTRPRKQTQSEVRLPFLQKELSNM